MRKEMRKMKVWGIDLIHQAPGLQRIGLAGAGTAAAHVNAADSAFGEIYACHAGHRLSILRMTDQNVSNISNLSGIHKHASFR